MLPTERVVLGGSMAIDCTDGAVTVSTSIGEVTPSRLAVMLLVPVPTAVASPAALIVATVVVAEFQVTCAVRSVTDPSEYIPVAVNCCVRPFGMDGLPGVTAIVCSVAAVTVSKSEGEVTPFKLAVM